MIASPRLVFAIHVCTLCCLPLLSARAQDTQSLDEARSGWQYRRSVTGRSEGGLVALGLPPDVRAHSAADLRDLRLVENASGREVPYLIEEQIPLREERRENGELVDTRVERHVQTVWIVDLHKPRSFRTLSLDVADMNFVKRLKLEAGPTRDGPFQVLAQDAGVFERIWPMGFDLRIRHTELTFPNSVQARFLRITADDRHTPPLRLIGAKVHVQKSIPGLGWSQPATVVAEQPEPAAKEASSNAGATRYRLELPPGLSTGAPIEEIELRADDPVYARRVKVVEVGPDGAQQSLGEGFVYRFFPFLAGKRKGGELAPSAAEKESPDAVPEEGGLVRLSRRPSPPGDKGKSTIFVQVENYGSPPLRNLRAVVSGTAMRLLFPLVTDTAHGKDAQSLTLYYGNPKARAPEYDLESLKGRVMGLQGLPYFGLGPEAQNPRFRPLPPLSFVSGLGATLQVQGHRMLRKLRFPQDAAEDIYGFLLQAEDLGVLREDLADLRIVDDADRQVPYVLSTAASERSLALPPKPAPSPRITRYEFALPQSLRGSPGLPIAAVDVEVKDLVFSRPLRVLGVRGNAATSAPPDEGRGEAGLARGEEELVRGQLARRPSEDADVELASGENAASVVLRVGLPSSIGPLRALAIEIDNQDNAPLQLAQVSAVVVVPRVAFKIKPESGKEYRVLMGARDAEAPHYDIELLRRAVLDYAALPIEPAELTTNPAYRARAADYLREAPPTLIIWSALGIGVLILLGLTVRLLRQENPA
jgi:hypothetical protein